MGAGTETDYNDSDNITTHKRVKARTLLVYQILTNALWLINNSLNLLNFEINQWLLI